MEPFSTLYQTFLESKGITTDSRKVEPGMIYWALRGDRFDGNVFVKDALEKGAKVAITDDPSLQDLKQIFLVEDTLSALQDFARYHRQKLTLPVIAITGSNGKTTTKELMAKVLGKKFKIFATPGNLNNYIGLPLSVLRLTDEHEMAILELGANQHGENALLADIAKPDYGIITNVGKDHLEGFGSPEGVKKANAELFDYLRDNRGQAFVNYDEPEVVAMSKGLTHTGYGMGNDEGPDYGGKILESEFFLKLSIEREPNEDKPGLILETQLIGEFHFSNVMCAYAVGSSFGIDRASAKEAIEGYAPDNNRTQLMKTARNTLLLDAYNANPSSMELILREFVRKGNDQNLLLILGDMNELGQYAEEEHHQIVDWLSSNFKGEVFLVGEEFGKWIHLLGDARHFRETGDLLAYLKEHPISDRKVLVKGSRSFELELVQDYL